LLPRSAPGAVSPAVCPLLSLSTPAASYDAAPLVLAFSQPESASP
jgi:hypothetical protein